MMRRRSIWSMTSASTPAASRLDPYVSYCSDVCCHAFRERKDHELLDALSSGGSMRLKLPDLCLQRALSAALREASAACSST